MALAITTDRPNVFGTLYVMSGRFTGASADFDIPLNNLGTVISFNVTPLNAGYPTAASASAVDASGSSPVGKVDFATTGAAGTWMAIGTRS